MKNSDKIISQIKAAEIAGVSKQNFTQLKKTRSFFTKAGKVDTSHRDWKSYLKEKDSKKKIAKKKKEIHESPNRVDDFDFQNFKPETIQEEKVYSEIQQKKIQLMQDLDLLIEKKIVASSFGEISKQIKSNFVDMGIRIAPRIAAKLKLPGSEKLIETIINEEIKKGVVNIISATEKAVEKL